MGRLFSSANFAFTKGLSTLIPKTFAPRLSYAAQSSRDGAELLGTDGAESQGEEEQDDLLRAEELPDINQFSWSDRK